MWTVEAFRTSDERLAWEIDLPGVEREALQDALGVDLSSPGTYPLTVEQARAAVALTEADDRGLGDEGLEFFLSEFAD